MFVIFTPFTFIFTLLYFLLIVILITIPNFYLFWLLIEVLILLIIGIAYSSITSSFSSLLLYFLVQTFSSFSLLIGFLFSSSFIFTLSLSLNLSLFPFHFWFLSLVYPLPNFIYFVAITFHKVPVLLILSFFSLPLNLIFLWALIVFSMGVSSSLIITSNDLRFVITSSSVGNNAWFILSAFSSFSLLGLFFSLYSLLLYFLVQTFSSFSLSPSPSYMSFFSLIVLSGIPPFPVFYVNVLIILSVFSLNMINTIFILFIVFASLMLVGYVQSLFNHFVNNFSVSPLFLF